MKDTLVFIAAICVLITWVALLVTVSQAVKLIQTPEIRYLVFNLFMLFYTVVIFKGVSLGVDHG